MNKFSQTLDKQLAAIRAEGLYRELRQIDSPQSTQIFSAGKPLLNFSSNDYLGLANDPALKEAAAKAIHDYGTGSGASRLISGSLAPHHQLEEALAAFKGTDAALTFCSGYAAALGIIGALLDKNDVIILDKLVHASIVDAARLSGAKLRVFAHNDVEDLERILKWASGRTPAGKNARPQRVLIVTESVFSMDGDLSPLREIVELKTRYGAWLMLDEAHATGLFGENRRGLAEAFELANEIEVQMGTLGKALGSSGGYICGSRQLIDLLINRARSFIFSTAPPPANSAAAIAAIQIVQSDEGARRQTLLWARVDHVKNGLIGGPWQIPLIRSAIIPVILGKEAKAVAMAQKLAGLGILIPAVRYPTVARSAARLRLTISAAHNPVDIAALLGAFDLCKTRIERKTGSREGLDAATN